MLCSFSEFVFNKERIILLEQDFHDLIPNDLLNTFIYYSPYEVYIQSKLFTYWSINITYSFIIPKCAAAAPDDDSS